MKNTVVGMPRRNHFCFCIPEMAFVLVLSAATQQQAFAYPQTSLDSLADLSLEQLSNLAVTSVSGRPESLREAAASVYVITSEDIRRSAATSLPEALRLAPNLQVAQLNAAQYAISARGFNNAIGNKLLVLIDGRTVYSPLFSGVFWDANDVVLEDVERIEVISGPGGTLWGANAVNGVINIITKPAAATQGTLLSVVRSGSGGSEMGRSGGKLPGGGYYRLYALLMDHDSTSRADGVVRPDSASKQQIGFRADLGAEADELTLQGDVYQGGKYPANNLAPKMSGANLLARWHGKFADGSPYKLQAYADQAKRDDVNLFRDNANTFDLQFSHEVTVPQGQQLLWGAGYRQTRDETTNSPVVAFLPASRRLAWTHVFAQHDLKLSEALQLTLGAKAERNVYTGWEFLPNMRLSFQHSEQAMTWGALSRAVRAPARLDKEFFSPGRPPYIINGGPAFESEVANVIELGHRAYAASGVSYSITGFQQRYSKLRSGAFALTGATLVNQIEGVINGLEGWASWQAAPAWRLSGGFLTLRKDLRLTGGSRDVNGIAALGNDPRLQWNLRSSLNISPKGEFDVMLRHVGSLPSPAVAAYTAVDARLAWQLSHGLELSVLAQNLLGRRHAEFNAIGVASQIERRIFIKAVWQL
jgi:iron complex outermembrane receptor protein